MSVYRNDEPSLFSRSLESIEGQANVGGPVRVYLCVDGPVPAAIESVVAAHRDRLYRVVRNADNQGLARSLNRLLDSLEDEAFVFRMDSDDRAHPQRFAMQIAALDARPEVDILGCGINEVDHAGRVLKTVRYPESDAEIRRSIAWRNPVAHPTVCFRRRAIGRFRHYPEVPVNQDWALWFRCLELGLVISNIPGALVDMTVSEDFFRRRGPRRALEEFRILLDGIWRIDRFTWRYVFPLMRFAFRLLPRRLVRRAYRSGLR
jgi:glycosyltransferase involved in cell wall biosynthesis